MSRRTDLLDPVKLVEMARWAQQNPLQWMSRFLGVNLWSIQQQIVESVRDNHKTAVVACHAIGKSYITACIAIWFLHAYPGSCVLLTAPTFRQVKEVLWREICTIAEMAPSFMLGKPSTAPMWNIHKKLKWFMLGFSPQHPEKAQGFHAPYVLVIIDEASGVTDGVLAALRGVMASGKKVRLLILGNPNKAEGQLFRAFSGGDQAGFKGRFQVSAWDTPNLAHLREQLWGERGEATDSLTRIRLLEEAPLLNDNLVNAKFVAEMERDYGIDSDVYKISVLGQFPEGGENILVPYHQIVEATHRWENIGLKFDSSGNPYIDDTMRWWCRRELFGPGTVGALDPAKYGSNESVYCTRLDTVVAPLAAWSGLNGPELIDAVATVARERLALTNSVDGDGLGQFLTDFIMPKLPGVIEFRGGAASSNSDWYLNKRAEGYIGLQQRYLQKRIAHPPDPKLMGQVSSIRYIIRATGEKQIESKDDMKARGVESPDRADSMMMCFATTPAEMPVQTATRLTNWNKVHF